MLQDQSQCDKSILYNNLFLSQFDFELLAFDFKS